MSKNQSLLREDQELINGIAEGSAESLSIVYKDNFPLVLQFITKNSGSEEDAKDLANNLKSGKSDTSLNIITEETIGIKTETPGKINTTKPENINKQDSISQPKNIYPPASPNLNKLGTVAPKYLANNSISVLINTVGLIEYILFKKSGEKLTWGKIQSNSSRSKVIIPGTNNLEAGEYRLELKKLTEKETSIFVIQ